MMKLLLGNPWVILGVFVALVTAYIVVDASAYTRGERAERHKWQAANAELMKLRQRGVDNAAVKRDETVVKVNTTSDKAIEDTRTYYEDKPAERAALCLPDDRVRGIQRDRGEIAAASGGTVSGEANPRPERTGQADR